MTINFDVSSELLPLRRVVYVIRHRGSGKTYVGLTRRSLRERLNGHRTRCANRYLASAIAKHGLSAFSVSVVASGLSDKALSRAERKTIRELASDDPAHGYNLTDGGEHFTPTKAVREHLSKVCRGWHHTPEAREKISASGRGRQPMLGKTHTKAARRKIAAAGRGRTWTDSQREANALWWSRNRERMSRIMSERKITWGDRISAAKRKLSLPELEGFVRANPRCSLSDVKRRFGLKSGIAVFRLGGLLAAKSRVLGPDFAVKVSKVVPTAAEVERMASLRAAGKSLRAVSRDVRLSPQTVARVLREKG